MKWDFMQSEDQTSELIDIDEIRSLAPRNDSNSNSQELYEKRLIAALGKKDIKNIALTGIYGSGKSTILNTFKTKYAEDWKFADISLSAFDTKDKKDLDSDDLQLIERSILQQLFYSVDHSVIPLSRFKRIVETSEKSKWFVFLLIIVCFISYLMLFSTNVKLLMIIPEWKYLPHFWFILLFLSSSTIFYKVLGYALALKEIKFKLHDAEFNIVNEEDKSILNDHIDEIIYFFQATGKNVVIVEDLDRFDNTEIFVRLRELNSLINGACKNRIVFIYAIKDNMFKGTERSKFFEYIIPVIPIINPNIAYDFIQENYKNVVEGVDNYFLRNTCLYFDDTRLVLNILNEYQDYKNHLGDLDLDKNQLFAMIVYKNYYPDRFADLNSNQGEIYEVFCNKKFEIVEEEKDKLSSKIMLLESKKELIINESLLSINELNALYSYYLETFMRKENIEYKSVSIEDKFITIQEYNEEFFLEISKFENKNIKCKDVYNRNFTFYGFSFQKVEDLTGSNKIYSERLSLIKDRETTVLKDIVDDIEILKRRVSSIEKRTMSTLLKNGAKLNINDQLNFFIMNGYINENYNDYISFFINSSISKSDKEYKMLINTRQNPNFEIELSSQNELVANYLLAEEMNTSSALNISMMAYLLGTEKHKKHRQNLIHKICDKSEHSIDFLNILFNKNVSFLSSIIPILTEYDNTVFDEVLNQVEDDRTVRNYSKIIKYTGSSLKNDSYLAEKISKFLSKRVDYIDYVKDSLEHDKASFQEFSLRIEPKFKYLEASNLELFNWLGGQGFFSIGKDIIKEVLSCNLFLSSNEVEILLQDAPLTTVCNSGINYLVDDFWKNINEYVYLFTMYLEDEKQLYEDEDILIGILNEEALISDSKERLLLVVATEINDICRVEETLHDKLFEYNVAKPTWENINKNFIFNEYELSERLIDFINKNAALLASHSIEYIEATSSNKEVQKKLEIELIKSNDLSNLSYEKILETITIRWKNIDFTGLNESKVLALITSNKLSLTKENLEHITAYDMSNVRKAFIEHYILLIANGELIESLDAVDYATIISSSTLNKARKQKFIEENMSKIIEIVSTLSKTIIDIFDNKSLPTELYNKVKDIGNEDHIQYLFKGQFNYLSSEEVLNLLSLMGEPFNELNKDSKTKFDLSLENKKILDALHSLKIVTKIDEIKRRLGSRYYETRLRRDL